eukprot:2086537-Amphidinium_carterae.1
MGEEQKTWRLLLRNMNIEELDCLVLVVYLPWGVELLKARKEFEQKLFSRGGGVQQAQSHVSIWGSRANCDLHSAWPRTILP